MLLTFLCKKSHCALLFGSATGNRHVIAVVLLRCVFVAVLTIMQYKIVKSLVSNHRRTTKNTDAVVRRITINK